MKIEGTEFQKTFIDFRIGGKHSFDRLCRCWLVIDWPPFFANVEDMCMWL